MNGLKMKWNKETKDKVSYIMACLAFIFGMGITIAGFIVNPLGVIHESVLWVLGQSLTYSGAVFGVGLFISNKSQEIKSFIKGIKEGKHKEDLED